MGFSFDLKDIVVNLLLGMFFSGLCVSIAALLRKWSLLAIAQLLLTVAFVGISMGVVSIASKKSAAFADLVNSMLRFDRLSIVAFVAGAAIVLSLALLSGGWEKPRLIRGLGMASLILANVAAVILWTAAFAPHYILGSSVKMAGYHDAELVWQFEDEPICICLDDDDNVYISSERYLDGREEGRLVKLSMDASGKWSSRSMGIAHGLLNRPFGLAWKDGSLYVSRSGRSVRATDSGLVYGNTGAVTRCRDSDGDGVMDSFLDILEDIPGFGGPDSQHGNNGIVFGKDDEMYLCVGTPTNRAMTQKPFEGCILRIPKGEKVPKIFAKGFRNPFGICINSRNEVFVTDNDADENPGDEVNYVVEGAHYGHPFVIPGEHDKFGDAYTEPIFVGQDSNLVGIVYLEGDRFPAPLQESLLVTDLAQDRVLSLKMDRSGKSPKVESSAVFAKINRPVGVATAKNGDIYVITRRPSNSLFRIKRKG